MGVYFVYHLRDFLIIESGLGPKLCYKKVCTPVESFNFVIGLDPKPCKKGATQFASKNGNFDQIEQYTCLIINKICIEKHGE